MCLTFNCETRRVSVTWRKHCWLTRPLRCPWRHRESTLPGHWYLGSNPERDMRNEQIQTDSGGGGGRQRGLPAMFVGVCFLFFYMKLKNWGKVKITLFKYNGNIYVKCLWVNPVSFFSCCRCDRNIPHRHFKSMMSGNQSGLFQTIRRWTRALKAPLQIRWLTAPRKNTLWNLCSLGKR